MIGRKQEVDELRRLYERNRAEWVAVYGRRRVGKTFLVDEALSGKFTFRYAGLSPVDVEANGLLRAQLDHFYNSLILFGMDECKKSDSWLDAFLLLEKHLQKIDDGTRQLVFLNKKEGTFPAALPRNKY